MYVVRVFTYNIQHSLVPYHHLSPAAHTSLKRFFSIIPLLYPPYRRKMSQSFYQTFPYVRLPHSPA